MEQRDEQGGAGQDGGRFILVVDDNAVERFYTTMLLQKFAYSVCTANTVVEAMDLMNTALPSLVIVDAGSEGERGVDLLRRMKNEPRLAHVPVLVLSENGTVAVEARCRAAGCRDFIPKPARAEDLYRAVQHIVEKNPRRSIRVTTYLKVDIGGDPPGGASYATVLSEDGMFVLTPRTRPKGMRIPINIMLEGRTIMIDAIVLYSYGFGEGPWKQPGMGLKFERITPEDRAVIRAFILEKINEGMPRSIKQTAI